MSKPSKQISTLLLIGIIGLMQNVRAALDSRFFVGELSPNGRQAYTKLLNAWIFAVGPVGFGAQTTETELALKALLTEREATRAFQSLVHSATQEGSLYGLLGLRLTDIRAFNVEIERYRERPESLEERSSPQDRFQTGLKGSARTARGCIIFNQLFQKLVKAIQDGDYDQVFRTSPAATEPQEHSTKELDAPQVRAPREAVTFHARISGRR